MGAGLLHENYGRAPTGGLEWLGEQGGDCGQRVVRGGSWYDLQELLRSSFRFKRSVDFSDFGTGFRLAQDIP